jgi:hypothetical protein
MQEGGEEEKSFSGMPGDMGSGEDVRRRRSGKNVHQHLPSD